MVRRGYEASDKAAPGRATDGVIEALEDELEERLRLMHARANVVGRSGLPSTERIIILVWLLCCVEGAISPVKCAAKILCYSHENVRRTVAKWRKQ